MKIEMKGTAVYLCGTDSHHKCSEDGKREKAKIGIYVM